MTQTIVVISDMQIPYHDKRAVANVFDFIEQFMPDEVASVGDEVDFPQVSRWNKGMEGEYRRDLQAHVDEGNSVLTRLREVAGDARIHVSRSNHMDRPLTYVRKYAPGLLGLRSLEIPALLGMEALGIEYHDQPYELAPGWLLAHGDEGNLNRTPGGTALGLARKWGKSVVAGHTHRLGLQPESIGYNGRTTKTIYGFEVGNLMNMKEADYLRAGHANWQKGFGILYIAGRHVTPVPVYMQANGSFMVEGQWFGTREEL